MHDFDEQREVVVSKGKNQALELGPPFYNLEFLQASVFPSVKRGILQFALKDFFGEDLDEILYVQCSSLLVIK